MGLLSTYHHEDGLLIQFIMYELILAFEGLEKAESLLSKKQFGKRLEKQLADLAGSETAEGRFFSWDSQHGILTKLARYCEFFARDAERKDVIRMERHATRSWMICCEALDRIREKESIDETIENLRTQMKRLCHDLEKVVTTFAQDENVAFFLLRMRKKMDSIYYQGFTEKLFDQMYPNGSDELVELLMKKYKKRGFDELIPLIESYIKRS